jgi:hypothetical protein
MTPINTREMEPRIRKRYHFAASSFSRMYGVDKVTSEMFAFCYRWAETMMPPPLQCLHSVDRYFKHLWDTSHTTF